MTEQLRIFAGLQGFVSAAGLLALVLFFALATPFGTEQRRWSWLGPVNDWLYVIGAVPWVVAMVLLVVRVRGGVWLWSFTLIVCALVVAGALVTLFMLAGRVGLNVQAAVAGPMTLAGIVWFWPAAAAAANALVIPRWVLAFSIAIVVLFVIGAAIIGSAFLVPAESAARTVLFVAGGVPLGLAMLASPTWWIVLASTAR